MARYTDANCRLCRREGQKLFLKGDRCYSAKCAMERRGYAPGQHGQGRSRLPSTPYSSEKSRRQRDFTDFRKLNSETCLKRLTESRA